MKSTEYTYFFISISSAIPLSRIFETCSNLTFVLVNLILIRLKTVIITHTLLLLLIHTHKKKNTIFLKMF